MMHGLTKLKFILTDLTEKNTVDESSILSC